MHFVSRHRLLHHIGFATLSQPIVVLPLVAAEIADDGSGLRTQLGLKGIRVGLFEPFALLSHERELVLLAGLNAGDEARPNAGVAAVQLMAAVLPAVGVADQRDLAGIRRPDSEVSTDDAVTFREVCAEVSIVRTSHAEGL